MRLIHSSVLILTINAIFGVAIFFDAYCPDEPFKNTKMFVFHHKTGTTMAIAALKNINNALPAHEQPLCGEVIARRIKRLEANHTYSDRTTWQPGRETWIDKSSRAIHFERDAYEWVVSNYLFDLRGGNEPWQRDSLDYNFLLDHRSVPASERKPFVSIDRGNVMSAVKSKVIPVERRNWEISLLVYYTIT